MLSLCLCLALFFITIECFAVGNTGGDSEQQRRYYSPSSFPIAVLVCSNEEATRQTLHRLELAEGFKVEQLHVFQDAVG